MQIHCAAALNPQGNRLKGRFHRTMKASLKARLTGPNWVQELPWVLLSIRTTPKDDLKSSSAELVYGKSLTVPGSFVTANTVSTMDSTRPYKHS